MASFWKQSWLGLVDVKRILLPLILKRTLFSFLYVSSSSTGVGSGLSRSDVKSQASALSGGHFSTLAGARNPMYHLSFVDSVEASNQLYYCSYYPVDEGAVGICL